MNCLWLVGQVGIVFEICGAAYIVWSACAARNDMKLHKETEKTIDGMENAVEQLGNIARGQFTKEMIGFGLLGFGLVMQFVGGFAAP